MSLTVTIVTLAYCLIGLWLGKRYWQQRHGVYKRVFGGGADVLFSMVFVFMFLWPALLLMPQFREPELCRCPDHVMARADLKRQVDAYDQALRDERGYGR